MFDDFAPRLAKVLTEYSVPIQKGDLVLIRTNISAEPFVLALYEAVLRRGANPIVEASLPGLNEIFFRLANDDQIDYPNPILMEMIDRIDVLFSVISETNTKSLAGVDPARMARRQKAQKPFIEKYFKRIADQSLRWNITAWPTPSSAQEAEMGLLDYTEFVYKACGLDHDDPVAYWQGFKTRQEKLVNWLDGKSHAEIKGPGVDLSFDFKARPWVSCHGTVNFPDGEIFTSPIEDTVNGHVEFSYPTMYGGRMVDGVKLVFKDGRAVEASAEKNGDYFLSQIDLDEGGRTLGEFAIGTNMGIQQFTGETLFDEKIGGTIHMALGESIAELKGVNKSQIHWDIVHSMRDGGEIRIDGELFYRAGEFMV